MLGKVAIERLSKQEKINEELSLKSKELERNFGLAQSTNLELEKKVAELAEALKGATTRRKSQKPRSRSPRKNWRKFRNLTKMT
jgi:hypothetical protein